MTTLFFILLAILLLGILITIHELGHFVAARLTRIPVEEFAIGFGPKLLGWKSKKHATVFSLRALPLGGFCAFYGEDDPDGGEKLEHPEWSLNNFAVWRRFIVILMGPVMNFVLAFVVALSFFFFAGASVPASPGIASVSKNTPAYEAGLQPGDQFVSINGSVILPDAGLDEIQKLIRAGEGRPANIKILRGNETLSFTIAPQFNEKENLYSIGIGITYLGTSGERIPLTFTQAAQNSWYTCVNSSTLILKTFGNLLKTGEGFDQMAGPVGTIDLISKQTRQFGFEGFVSLLIMISINLGLFNLFPIPGLDGSRLIFLLAEKVCSWFGVKINRKFEAIVHLSGFFLMIGLAVFFTYKDILRIFS